jgi:Grx4 family monothiol glutaredoxin
MTSTVVQVTGKEQWEALVEASGKSLLVTHFHASWSDQSQQVQEVLLELVKNKDFHPATFAEVDAVKFEDLSKVYGVSSAPTCVLVANGKPVASVEGADIPQLTKKVKEALFKHFPFSVNSIPSNASEKSDINTRLSALVNKATVMVFMKGSPAAPRCGFSRTLVGILQELNIKYETFDILEDEEVRQGLKTFSNWPTYPQVYAKGTLVGGLDIIKELQEMGELEQTLTGQ